MEPLSALDDDELASLVDLVRFTLHSVVKDPPFSRIDLISCRNLMIYLRPEAQAKIEAHLESHCRKVCCCARRASLTEPSCGQASARGGFPLPGHPPASFARQ